MREEIMINGKKMYILIEPHALVNQPAGAADEYFTASYASEDPPSLPGGILFVEEDNTPKRFGSPVQALEYANEKLLGLIS